MIETAEKKGLLKKDTINMEPTSGNTGIGPAAAGITKRYQVILTMPETMNIGRQNRLKDYGVRIVLADGAKGMNGAIEKEKELAKQIPNSYISHQFSNGANVMIHKQTTGTKIWKDTQGKMISL